MSSSRPYVIVMGDFVRSGGMHRANLAAATLRFAVQGPSNALHAKGSRGSGGTAEVFPAFEVM
jgi:hypothetical protein